MNVKRSNVTRTRLVVARIEHELELLREKSESDPAAVSILSTQLNDAMSEHNRVFDEWTRSHDEVAA